MDSLQRYVELRESLTREKQEIEQRLQEINEALGDIGSAESAAPSSQAAASSTGGAGRQGKAGRPRGSARGGLSLRDAVLQVTSNRPMTKEEILKGVKGLGYRFSTNDPLNSLGVILYGKNPRFKNEGGRFSQAGRSGNEGGTGGGGARDSKPGSNGAGASTMKRQLSPDARERIAAAQRARWAKSKRGK